MNVVLAVLDAVINTLWQAVMIAAAVWLALRFLSRINAATRHAIWWATLAVVLILPVTPRVLSSLRAHPAAVSAPIPAPRYNSLPSSETPPLIIRVTPDRTAKWPLVIFVIWAAILLWRLLQIARSYVFLRGMKQRAAVSPIPLPMIARRATLLVSKEVASPMAVGFVHPAVILPAALLGDLTDAEREHVLLHEAAHLAGYDDWSNLAMRLLGGALALHPVAIWILRRVEREREIACDDWVVARTGAARPYAESLAHLFELREAKRNEMLASGIFGRNSRVGDRIEILLRRGRTFSPKASPRGVASSAVLLAILMLGGSLAPRWIAFAQPKRRPSFEVASIKPGDPSSRQVGVGIRPGGRFSTTNASLQMLIGFAYDLRNHQVSGGPNWINSSKFNIDAKADGSISIPPGPVGASPMRLMLQSLLVERFKLAAHKETREEQVFEFVVNKGGPKLKEVADPGPTKPNGLQVGPGELPGTAAPISLLANQLSQRLGRSIIDKTGLTGKYDFKLGWSPDSGALGPDGGPPPDDASGPSIFTAVQDQLGLRLQSAKGTVEVLVIDHVEKPGAN